MRCMIHSLTLDNGLGMRVMGGLELPGPDHPAQIGAFVTEILPGGVVDTHGQVSEGQQSLPLKKGTSISAV